MPTKRAAVPPSPDAGRGQPRPEARARLLDAAQAVLREEGFHALTQTRVAERSGLRQSHLTYYFPRRADLLMAVAEAVAGQVQDSVSIAASAPPLDIGGLRRVLRAQLGDRQMPRLMLSLLAAADEDARLRTWLAEFHAGIAAILRAALLRAGFAVAEDELALFHGSLLGLRLVGQLSGASDAALARQLDAAIDRLLAVARPAGTSARRKR